ncbi:MAG: M64 family metallopeptidase [Bacteroidales bacterium]|nr:M64 family metallopeptidase [Bacteroidales bacterium]
MKRFSILFLAMGASLLSFAQHSQSVNYNQYFTGETMRVDYFHTGTANEEHFSLDRIINDGAWAGSESVLLDELNRGLYFYKITDTLTNTLLYSRGFASVFGEWQSIGDPNWGTFHESVRFPWPKLPVKLTIEKRDTKNNFVAIWSILVDPKSRVVNPAVLKSAFKTFPYFENGKAADHVDIVILGDGYTAAEMDKFHKDVKSLTDELFTVEPYKSRKADFNVRAVETPSATSGVNKPHPGVFNRTPLSMSYGAFDSERYALSYDNRTIRDVAASVPYDYMFILINERTYGGGGIFNLYSTVAADNKFSRYIFVHEFGHSFAALADEYYTSDVSYQTPAITVEPWEPNVTALLDTANLKWKELVKPGTPIPTPWNKTEFDNFSYDIQKERRALRAANVPEAQMEALFEREKKTSLEMFSKNKYKDATGAFEGGNYMQFGLYRSALDCIMFTRNKQEFCPACTKAISEVIDMYAK